jgi:hypothetical protein
MDFALDVILEMGPHPAPLLFSDNLQIRFPLFVERGM